MQGLSLSEAVQGGISDVKKLVGLEHKCGRKRSFEKIKRWWNTTSEPSQRNLLHWVTFHNDREILKWYRAMCSSFYYEYADAISAEDVYGYTVLHLATIVKELFKHREVSIYFAANNVLFCEENGATIIIGADAGIPDKCAS